MKFILRFELIEEDAALVKGFDVGDERLSVTIDETVGSSFTTPIGSPTHRLVYGPGGYRFSDFLKIGLIMNLIILAANILIVNLIYPLTPLT